MIFKHELLSGYKRLTNKKYTVEQRISKHLREQTNITAELELGRSCVLLKVE